MKVIQFARYGEPDVLELREVPDPVAEADEVLIEVKATTVNRLDLFQRAGSRPVEKLPFTPGLEAAGLVLRDANGFKAGERVLTTRALRAKGGGGYASKLAVKAADLARIPASVSFEQAAAAGLAASTAWGSLFDLGNLQAGERVLIWAGSSGVGTMAIQLAKQARAWVATTASSDERAETLLKLGADLVINYKTQRMPDSSRGLDPTPRQSFLPQKTILPVPMEDIGRVLQEMGGVNLVIELVSSTLATSLQASALDGRIILVGNLGGPQVTINTQTWRLQRTKVLGGGQVLTSVINEERILSLIAGKITDPLIACTMPIAQAAEAHRRLANGEPQGKIVLTHN